MACIRTLPCAVTAAALLAGAPCFADGFNFTFDNDVQGWTRGDFGNGFANINVNSDGSAVHASSLGNGYILGSDHAGYAFHFSPDLGGGHGGLFGEFLSVDFRTAGAGADNPFVVLMSSTDFLVKQQVHAASSGFLPYSYALDSTAGWYINSSPYYNGGSAVLATDAQIQAVLADLRHVGISTDIVGGGDTTWTDNVRAVPAPSSLALVGVGALSLGRRRR